MPDEDRPLEAPHREERSDGFDEITQALLGSSVSELRGGRRAEAGEGKGQDAVVSRKRQQPRRPYRGGKPPPVKEHQRRPAASFEYAERGSARSHRAHREDGLDLL